MNNPLRILSLFSGIGGFELAAEQINLAYQQQMFLVAQMCEKDLFCQKVLNKNFPNIPIHDDITTFTAPPGAYDIITAGFPCQDISGANPNGRGLEGKRSGLFFEVIRILRLVQPSFLLLENVPALINGGLDRVLWELAQSRFDAEWQVVSASSVGAPHLRERVFIVAYPQGIRSPGRCSLQGRTNTASISLGSFWQQNPPPEPTICRMDAGLPSGVATRQLKALGNTVVPQCAAIAYQRILEIKNQ